MKNNWVFQAEEDGFFAAGEDYDDYGYGSTHPVSIGDEIIVDDEDRFQAGVVVGIIRNIYGAPVCYKIVSCRDENDLGDTFDYVSPSDITLCEPCGSAEWSLDRVGYKWTETEEEGFFYNKETKDVIPW